MKHTSSVGRCGRHKGGGIDQRFQEILCDPLELGPGLEARHALVEFGQHCVFKVWYQNTQSVGMGCYITAIKIVVLGQVKILNDLI